MSTSLPRTIVLCADDFGQNATVCEGIVRLVANNRLSAVSCMANGAVFPAYIASLKPYQSTIDIGLHLNLTEGTALSELMRQKFPHTLPSLKTLSKMLLCKQLPIETLKAEITAQLNTFQDNMGHAPDFIDGHQHIHHFPQIRQALLQVYQQYFPKKNVYIRISATTPMKWWHWDNFPKKQIIALTGAIKLQKQLEQLSIPYNKGFAGIYSFKHAPQYRHHFQSFLQQIGDHGLIMCHPGLSSIDQNDPLYQDRMHEYQYLMSDDFLNDCRNYNVRISKLCQT